MSASCFMVIGAADHISANGSGFESGDVDAVLLVEDRSSTDESAVVPALGWGGVEAAVSVDHVAWHAASEVDVVGAADFSAACISDLALGSWWAVGGDVEVSRCAVGAILSA